MFLAEKLLLDVLIFLAPILLFNLIADYKKWSRSRYFLGAVQGISASLCLLFAEYSYGLYWDLRYIPLVLGILYGGRLTGCIAFLFLAATRTYLGGDALLFGYASALLSFVVPMLAAPKFFQLSSKKRILGSILMGCWPAVVHLAVLMVYLVVKHPPKPVVMELFRYIGIYEIIQIAGIGLASILIESIIERNLMKKEINRAEKLNTIGELAASIAHEVRNPLTVVKGFLQLMQREEKEDKHSYLPLVLSELGRAEAIINDYLNFAKPEIKKLEHFSVNEFVNDLYILLNPFALNAGVLLNVKSIGEPQLYTDRSQLKQAMVNIVKNAIEATPSGGKVEIYSFDMATEVQVVIQDTGTGMTEEQLARVGTLYYSTKDNGTGLGTMVSMRIIESMSGRVLYESTGGEGTKVTVVLPLSSHVYLEERHKKGVAAR